MIIFLGKLLASIAIVVGSLFGSYAATPVQSLATTTIPAAVIATTTIHTSLTISTSDQQEPNGYYNFTGDAQCSQGAQQYADSMSNISVQDTQSGTMSATSYIVAASHYVPSQNSCYIEMHEEQDFPSSFGGYSDSYMLLVTPGFIQPTNVATCITQVNANWELNSGTNNYTSCNTYDPIEGPDFGLPIM